MSRYSRSKKMSRRAELARRRSRQANSGIPGYDNLGWDHFGHPASSEQPDLDAYGIDSDFGEDVRKGPYSSGPAPASVGWTPEHPATSDEVVEGYALTDDLRQENLKKAMERKAAKCIQIAESRLGRTASQREIEDLALRMMDLPNRTVNARVARLADNAVQVSTNNIVDDFGSDGSGELEADDHMSHGMFDEYDIDGDEMIDMEEWGGSDEMFEGLDSNEDGFLSRDEIAMGLGESFADEMGLDRMASSADALAEEIATLKAANARLARKVRKLADNAVQVGTGNDSAELEASEDDTVATEEEASEDDTETKQASEVQPTQRLAKIERLAEALSNYMADMETSADEDAKSLLAELEGTDMNDSEYGYTAEEGLEAPHMGGEDIMGLDMDADESIAMDPRLASIFTASEEEASEEEVSEEEASEEEASEEEASEEATKKKASYRPRTSARKAAVKTLGNISREASSSSDELSKLWDSAPDVSKFFG